MMMNAGPGKTISAMPNARLLPPITATATLRTKRKWEVVTAGVAVCLTLMVVPREFGPENRHEQADWEMLALFLAKAMTLQMHRPAASR